MSASFIVGLGLILVIVAGIAAGRAAQRGRKREAVLIARLDSLRPAAAAAARAASLFGAESGPRLLRVRFARADIQVERRSVYAGLAITAGIAIAVAWLFHPLIALIVAGAAGAAAFGALELLSAHRAAALVRELPFLLDGVRQQLTVGASLQQGLIRAVDQASADVKRHFQPAVRRMQNGATAVEALSWLAARLEIAEIDMLSLAVQTNTRFGGAMSPTLANLAQILRDKARITRELHAATAETRFSGWVLAGLPVLAIAFIAFANPAYAAYLTGTPAGHAMLAFAFSAQAAGWVVMSRILKLDF